MEEQDVVAIEARLDKLEDQLGEILELVREHAAVCPAVVA